MPETTPASYALPPSELASPEPTAPGAAITVPQEQLDEYAALVLSVMQLRNYVALNRARLPSALLERWDAWYRGLAGVLQRTQTDQVALRQVLSELPRYRSEFALYRDAFARLGGPPAPSAPLAPADSAQQTAVGRSGLCPVVAGGAGLLLGLVAGSFASSRRS